MHRTILMTIALLTTVLGFLANVSAAENGRTFSVLLQGKDVGETRTIPLIEATKTNEGNCFDVDLIDVMTKKVIGTAARCFADINTVGTGMALTETTFFRLKEGTIVSRSRVIIQPTIDGSPEVTHTAVAIPGANSDTVLAEAGSGGFKGSLGSARLAGTMDMRRFHERNEIVFNDMAVIELADRDTLLQRVQKQLQVAGFYSGPIDGMFGPQTKTALRQYQARHGLPATGELDEATRRALSGMVATELTDGDVRLQRVQKQLQVAGFYSGPIDGVFGAQTKTALRQYQARHGLPATGELDEATRRALGV